MKQKLISTIVVVAFLSSVLCMGFLLKDISKKKEAVIAELNTYEVG